MRLGLHIEILFAHFGFLAKPQPRVIKEMCYFALRFGPDCILSFPLS